MNDASPDPERLEDDLWKGLTTTPTAWIVVIVSFVSGPLAFASQYGALWFIFACTIAATVWWFTAEFGARERFKNRPPGKRLHSKQRLALTGLLPIGFACALGVMSYLNVTDWNIWRQDYAESEVLIVDKGRINKYFGNSAPKTTPAEKARHDLGDWVRLMDEGAQSMYKNKDSRLLFIASEEFGRKYRTFDVEVHCFCNNNHVGPLSNGSAFLVRDVRGDPWYRPIFRSVPCDSFSDGETRMFRVVAQNPEPGESLWIFVCVEPDSEEVSLDNLNIKLMVR